MIYERQIFVIYFRIDYMSLDIEGSELQVLQVPIQWNVQACKKSIIKYKFLDSYFLKKKMFGKTGTFIDLNPDHTLG